MAVADLPSGRAAGEVRFAGVGNVVATVVSEGERNRSLMSHNGTAGVEARRIQQFAYPWRAATCS